MNNKIRSFEDFMKHKLLEKKEEIDQDESSWAPYFSDLQNSKEEAGKDSSQGKDIPDWAKKGLQLDALKGKSADERWSWLTDRVQKVLKDQTSKIEEIKQSNVGSLPGYRLLWKETKTETGDQQDKSGKVYKVYFTEIYKGNPGTWTDKKDEGGKPGATLATGYWGQNSRVAKPSTTTPPTGAAGSAGATGATGSSPTNLPKQSSEGGILWVDEPEKVSAKGGTMGDMKLIDLFAATEMGKSVLTSIMGDSEMLKDLQKKGKINFTDSPPTVDSIDKEFTAEEKEVQKKNLEKLKEMGTKAVKPDFKLISSSGDYNFRRESLNLSWEDVSNAVKSAKLDSGLDSDKWTIVGIRNELSVKNQFQNRFTDLLVLMSPKDKKEVKVYPITTTPGLAFAYVPFRNWYMASALKDTINPDGVAILQTGIHEYQVGNHKGYTALVPAAPTKVGRMDPVLEPSDLKFKTFEPTKKQTGNFGINIHRALAGDTPTIDTWSAGCQVFKNGKDFEEFMTAIQGKAKQGKYKYILINSSDVGKSGSRLA